MMKIILILLFITCNLSQVVFSQTLPVLSKIDNDEIRFLANKRVEEDLRALYNTIAFEDAGQNLLAKTILNSYTPSTNQVFYSSGVIIEDDVSPENTIKAKGNDKRIDRYLNDMNLFYSKSGSESIFFSEISVDTKVQAGQDYYFVKVYFKSDFRGKHKNQQSYKPILRIAELRAERENGKWKVLISGIRFYREEVKSQEQIRQEELRQEAIRKEATRQEAMRQDTAKPVVALQNIKPDTTQKVKLKIETIKTGGSAWRILVPLLGVGAAAYAYSLNSDWKRKLDALNTASTIADPTNSGNIRSAISFNNWQNAYNEAKTAQGKQSTITACVGVAIVAAIVEIVLLTKPKKNFKNLSISPASQGVGMAVGYKF